MARNSVKLLLAALLAFVGTPTIAQNAYPLFEPADGILVGDQDTYVTTPATSADVRSLWSGTCDISTWLRGDGSCALLTTSGQALTRTNDTNVTLTLGGTPTTALLAPTSLTLGWTGQLAASRGGTGVSSLGNITDVDDTNVTLTLGGTPTGAVINSTSFTLGWTGLLAPSRGGLGISTVTDDSVPLANGTTYASAVIPGCLDTSGNHLNYNASTNSFLCGTSSSVSPVTGANPTATIGLSAVNGSSPNFLRSDGAPALSQAIAPTWSAVHNWGTISPQSSAVAAFRGRGNAIEWGHTNTAGYGSTIGFEASSGNPFVAFNAEAGTTNNTYRTRGIAGNVVYTNAAGTLLFGHLANANADNQTIVQDASINSSSLTFGNATNNQAFTFNGSGTTTFGGTVSVGASAATPTGGILVVRPSAGTASVRLQSRTDTADDANWIQWYRQNGSTERGWIGFGSNGSDVMTIQNQLGALNLGTGSGSISLAPNSGVTGITGNLTVTGTGDFQGRQFSAGGATNSSTAVQLCHSSSGYGQIGVNVVCQAGGTESYGTSDVAGRIAFSNGTSRQWRFDSAAASTGTISWVNQATLSANGDFTAAGNLVSGGTANSIGPNNSTATNLTVGTTSAFVGSANRGVVSVNGVTDAFVALGNNGSLAGYVGATSSNLEHYAAASRGQVFYTNASGTASVTMPSAGGVTIGAPTGGGLGSGTLNTAGDIRINNVSVCQSNGTNCPSSTLTRVVKASNTSRSSTTTLSADPELTFAATGTATYKVESCLRFNGTTTGTQGIKFVLNRTTAGSNGGFWGGNQYVGTTGTAIAGVGTPGSSGTTTGQVAIATIDVSGSVSYACLKGVFDLTSGVSYAIEWAQNSSSANNTTMLAGSYLEYSRVN